MRSSFVRFWIELKIQWPHTHTYSNMHSVFILCWQWPMDTFIENSYIQFSYEFLWVVFQRAHMHSFVFSLRVANTHEYRFTCIRQHVYQIHIYKHYAQIILFSILTKFVWPWIVQKERLALHRTENVISNNSNLTAQGNENTLPR